MKINNMPDLANGKKYIVFRTVDGEAWFYGAWDDAKKAIDVACEVDGKVILASKVHD